MSENNFNVCSRCGGANPLSARYCYQCGFELKSPDAPVVCTKCNTVNQGVSNFCKRCGSKLPKAQSKVLCPQCSATNNSNTTFCANCGYDFTVHALPSSLAITQKTQQETAASSAVECQDKKLSRKEKKKLKREEEERVYREEIAAIKKEKEEKKEAKKRAKEEAKNAKKQPEPQLQAMQYPIVVQPHMQYIPPMVQQPVQEQKAKKYRFNNFVLLLIALAGLFFIFLPQKFNFLGDAGALFVIDYHGLDLYLTGWDVAIFTVGQFVPQLLSMSTVANTYAFDSLWLFMVGVVLLILAVVLAFYALAKLFGVLTGRPHRGFDGKAFLLMILSGALVAVGVVYGVFEINFRLYSIVIPATFLLILIFNSKKRAK